MMMKRISIAACLFVAACGGQDDGPDAQAEPTAYEEMNFEQRHAFMSDVVLPEMKKTFVAFDPKFEDMSCATCHGSGATDGSYAMPSSDIPLLPATEEEFYEYVKDPEHGKWSMWMMEEVWPQMADLLQIPVYSETNPTGFSCSNCHMHEGQH
jgi:hypothetical protein